MGQEQSSPEAARELKYLQQEMSRLVKAPSSEQEAAAARLREILQPSAGKQLVSELSAESLPVHCWPRRFSATTYR
jgi:hypothetical protein